MPFIANAIILDRQDPRAQKFTCKIEWFLGTTPVVSVFHIQSHTSLAGAHNIDHTFGKLVCHHFHAELQVASHQGMNSDGVSCSMQHYFAILNQ